MLTKLDVVKFLRKNGYTVIFHPTERGTLLVDGKRAFISIKQKVIRYQKKKAWQKKWYDATVPQQNRKTLQYDYCFIVCLDRDGFPVYKITITGPIKVCVYMREDNSCMYPVEFIGVIDLKRKAIMRESLRKQIQERQVITIS